jgi:16S rRNA (adenine1518-N6/adenine1519-N6)-dimethyltransferase
MGNLPYNISSQVLVQLIQSRKYVSRAILMFQKELALRIMASPGGKDYGRITAMLKYCSDIKSLAIIKSPMFFPKPKVDSEVVEICFKETPEYIADNEDFLFKVIKAGFGKRRKTLRNSLGRSELMISTDTAGRALEQAEIDPIRRAETLTVHEFVNLSHALTAHIS